MIQPSSATKTDTSPALPPGRPSALMVMPLRAAEQHVLVVVGEADMNTAGQLRRQLIEMLQTQPASVVVELGALEFCDLAGLDALHDADRVAQIAGVALTFRGMSRQLSWLQQTFPPRSPRPPSSIRGPVPSGPDALAGSSRSASATAPAAGRAAPQDASQPRSPTAPATPAPTASAPPGYAAATQASTGATGRAGTRPVAGPLRSAGAPAEHRTRTGRGKADPLLHAVPAGDRTRSAVCGARTRPATTSWTGADPDGCPACAATLAEPFPVPTAHRVAAPGTGQQAPRGEGPDGAGVLTDLPHVPRDVATGAAAAGVVRRLDLDSPVHETPEARGLLGSGDGVRTG